MEKSRFVLISKLISTVTIIVGMIILGQMYGMIGVAIAFLIANCSDAIFLSVSNNFIKQK